MKRRPRRLTAIRFVLALLPGFATPAMPQDDPIARVEEAATRAERAVMRAEIAAERAERAARRAEMAAAKAREIAGAPPEEPR
ncbi:MAG: hypothetical protein ACREQ9_22340 [Candidatus Binatia bacterium]